MKKLFSLFVLAVALVLPPSVFGTSIDIGYISSGLLDVQVEVPLQYANHSAGVWIINTDTNEIVADYAWLDCYVFPAVHAEGVGSTTNHCDWNYLDFSLTGLPEGNYRIVAEGDGGTYGGWGWEPIQDMQVYYW